MQHSFTWDGSILLHAIFRGGLRLLGYTGRPHWTRGLDIKYRIFTGDKTESAR